MEKSKVYFSKEITPEKVVEIFKKLNVELGEKVAVKLHSGEKGNQNYIRPEFVKPIIDLVNGTVVECNTAYSGARNSTEKHKQLMKEHKWTDYFDVDRKIAQRHAYTLKFNKTASGEIEYIITNPWNTGRQIKLSREELENFGSCIEIAEIA